MYLLFFEQACIIQVERSQIFFAYETAYFVLISRNVSVTILVDGSSQTGFVETFFIQRGIFVEVNFLVLSLMYYFGTDAQVVSEFSFRKRQAEVELNLKSFS